MSSNDETKFADWVCYYLTPHETQPLLDLKRKWRNDPWLEEDETLEATPDRQDDYKVPREERIYDRGHLAPLASFKGTRFASQTNYYSNIIPQKSAMNQGPWSNLEDKVRGLVDKYDHVWVMTGPLYERQMLPLLNCDEEHKVPSGFWKIIAVKENAEIHVAAFIMDQDTLRSSDIMNHLVTLRDVENRSNLNFLWQLPDTKEEHLETNIFNAWVQEWAD